MWRRAVAALAVFGTFPVHAAEIRPRSVFEVRLRHAATAAAVHEALQGASRRLQRPDCQAVFSDFSDKEGRPLSERLLARGQTPQEYLGQVLFYDGATQPRCQARRKDVLAVTTPGSPVVFVCPEALRDHYRSRPLYVEATFIHEALHTLGLGEDPPTSREITARVVKRCGS